MPQVAANVGPSKKSRLPCMKNRLRRWDAVARTWAQRTSKLLEESESNVMLFVAISSPTQTSNRSPSIKTASACVVCMKFCQAPKVAGSLASRCRSEMKSSVRHCGGACSTGQLDALVSATRGGTAAVMLKGDSLFHDHVFNRHVVVVALAAGFDGLDLVNHFFARHHFAKYGVAPALR